MVIGFALGLIALSIPTLLINAYFASLVLNCCAGARSRLSALFNACGAETSSCAIVVESPYARLFAGAPNVVVGVLWVIALFGLAGYWVASGTLVVPLPYLVVALGSLGVGAYLIHALVVVLKEPCPL